MRQIKVPEDKFTYKIAKNRYKTRLNQLRANAWLSMNQSSWVNCLSRIGEVIVDEDDKEKLTDNKPNVVINTDDLAKEFNGKRLLYQHFGFMNEKQIPEGYEIRSRYVRTNNKKQRLYRLVKVE